jgi:hypothetical protein
LKIKKREEIELKKELKREEKKNKRRAEITRRRLKIDPAYVEKKSENSPEEVKKIFTSIRKVSCALDELIEKYNFTDFKTFNNLKIEEEMLDTAKDIVEKIEKFNYYVSHMGRDVNSDISFPSDPVEVILGI